MMPPVSRRVVERPRDVHVSLGSFCDKKSWPCLAFPAGYVTGRAPRSFPGLPPFYGEVKLALRERPAVERLALCSFVGGPSFRRAANAAGRVSRLGHSPTRSAAEGAGLDAGAPSITLRAFEGGRKDRRGPDAGRAIPGTDAGASPALGGSPGRRDRAATDRRQGRHSRLHAGAQRAAKPPPRGGRGVTGSRGTGRAQRRRCLPCAPPGGADR